MRAANQVSVSQAALLLRHSFHVTTFVISSTERPSSAAATEPMPAHAICNINLTFMVGSRTCTSHSRTLGLQRSFESIQGSPLIKPTNTRG